MYTPKSAPGMPIMQPQKRAPIKAPKWAPVQEGPPMGSQEGPKNTKMDAQGGPQIGFRDSSYVSSEKAPNWTRRKVDSK